MTTCAVCQSAPGTLDASGPDYETGAMLPVKVCHACYTYETGEAPAMLAPSAQPAASCEAREAR